MRPVLAPVGDGCAEAHQFPENAEPEHVTGSAGGREAGADPGAKDGDEDEERGAGEESGVGGDAAANEVAGEDDRKAPGLTP